MAFKMKSGGEGPMKKNFPSAFKQVKFKDLSKEEKQKSLTKMTQLYNAKFPPKGKPGTKYRKREYDSKGWAYDETIPKD